MVNTTLSHRVAFHTIGVGDSIPASSAGSPARIVPQNSRLGILVGLNLRRDRQPFGGDLSLVGQLRRYCASNDATEMTAES
jgi:hypothetical protein